MTGVVAAPADDHLLYLSRRDVLRACEEIDPVATVAEALRLHALGQTTLPDEAYLAWTNGRGEGARSLNMPGYLGGPVEAAGTKIINANPANPGRGLARASGLTALFDPESARVVCVMEGAHISALRTASVSALAAEVLGRRPLARLAVIGAGDLARAHLVLLGDRLPDLREVRLFDLDAARAARLAAEVQARPTSRSQSLTLAGSAEAAIRGADLVVAATTTTTGYIPLDWLAPGSLLVNVSLDDPLDEVVFGVDRVVVDDWHLVSADRRRLLGRLYHAGRLHGPADPAPPAPTARRVDAELGDVLVGRHPGRCHDDERILVNPFGLSIEDVAVAARVYRIARERGFGLPLDR